MNIYGCNNCYSPYNAEPPEIGILKQFYIQSLTGPKFLIALCKSCQKRLHEIENRDSTNEGINFIQDIIRKNNNR